MPVTCDVTIDVYRLTCSVTGKSYIGITRTGIKRRWREHQIAAMAGAESALSRALRKYGAECFTVVVLYSAINSREAQAVERGLIAAYGTLAPSGYNLTSGGEHYSGYFVSTETRLKRSASLRAYYAAHKKGPLPDDIRARISAKLKGRKLSEEECANRRGRTRSPETIAKFRKSFRPVFSAEHRAKISAAQKGKPKPAEQIARQAESLKRKWKDDPAYRVRMSEAHKKVMVP